MMPTAGKPRAGSGILYSTNAILLPFFLFSFLNSVILILYMLKTKKNKDEELVSVKYDMKYICGHNQEKYQVSSRINDKTHTFNKLRNYI